MTKAINERVTRLKQLLMNNADEIILAGLSGAVIILAAGAIKVLKELMK